ncbi:hypothetical protein [Sporolactobacillus sp. KGMB 08714]|uniref:hypothetical protein n=1 Tax=Sporolactobacillus sp. KGMB 08714 TaxID=3064704 RepID=UPI002FBE0F6E
MNLMTDELKDRFLPTDLPAVQKEIETVEMMNLRWTLNMAIGQIEDAQENMIEACRSMQNIEKMADSAQAWRNTHRLMAALQGMGYDIRKVEVKGR